MVVCSIDKTLYIFPPALSPVAAAEEQLRVGFAFPLYLSNPTASLLSTSFTHEHVFQSHEQLVYVCITHHAFASLVVCPAVTDTSVIFTWRIAVFYSAICLFPLCLHLESSG